MNFKSLSYFLKALAIIFLTIVIGKTIIHIHNVSTGIVTLIIVYILLEGVESLIGMFINVGNIKNRIHSYKQNKRIIKTELIVNRLTKLKFELQTINRHSLLELENKLSKDSVSDEEKEKKLIKFLDEKDKLDSLCEKVDKTLDVQQDRLGEFKLNSFARIHFSQSGDIVDGHHRARMIAQLHDQNEEYVPNDAMADTIAQMNFMRAYMNQDVPTQNRRSYPQCIIPSDIHARMKNKNNY